MVDQAPTPAPKRRWSRFSLRWLFVVVTVFGCWLGWELSWVQQRRTAFIHTPAFTFGANEKGFGGGAKAASIPFWRTVLGDKALSQIVLSPRTDKTEAERIARLFPEAQILKGTLRDAIPLRAKYVPFSLRTLSQHPLGKLKNMDDGKTIYSDVDWSALESAE